jgi:uncharacterized protein YkwD
MKKVFALALAFALVACMTGPPAPKPIGEQMKALQMRLFLIVEEKRHRLDTRAKPLALDPQLVAAAQAHADAMAKAHAMDGKNGDANPAIHALLADPDFQGFVGENVAQQYYNASQGIDVEKFAATYLDLWMKSDDHRRNLAFWGFDKTGIGLATDGKAIFVSEIFATDLGLPPRPKPADAAPPEQPAPTPAPKENP